MTGAFVEDIIKKSSRIKDTGNRIEFISRQFIGVDYRESTLSGSLTSPEALVINLKEVDCFTFIDYVEAIRLSRTYEEFVLNLKRVRYRAGVIGFENRNHFFTDWRENNKILVEDVTRLLGTEETLTAEKLLNDRGDGTHFVEGIRPEKREISYIPSGSVSSSVADTLKTGDYAGFYSDLPGLDVSHVGIIIRQGENLVLRHASSLHRRVLDENFREYLSGKPGIIILRPFDH